MTNIWHVHLVQDTYISIWVEENRRVCVCVFNYQTKDNYNEADICSPIIVIIIISDTIVIFLSLPSEAWIFV